MTKVMIVESAAKAKKIAGFLGTGWRVEACMGHVRDLPKTGLGVDVDQDFQPAYEVLPNRANLVRRVVKAMREAESVYVATDPDREGEAIAWHLLDVANLPLSKPVFRAVFNAITADAVQQAVEHPRSLDLNLIEAQHARRIVDRLVGYLASPLAAKALNAQVSAGRVQSVCLRLIVEREREIKAFHSEPFWTLALKLSAEGVPFTAELAHMKGVELPFKDEAMAARVSALLTHAQVWVQRAGQIEKQRYPLPPFTTASLQQAAAKRLDLSPERTMTLAQRLYDAGWITYLRTDGVAVAPEAQTAARTMIEREYGADYLPETPPIYVAKTLHAQEAHEAIRPTDVDRLPQELKGEDASLYGLIWQRFIASQMQPARYRLTGALIQAGKRVGAPFPLQFRAHARSLAFDGFLKVYAEPIDMDEDTEVSDTLPPLRDGQPLTLIEPGVSEGHTRAPARFTDAALVEALEAYGVGRPSTYAKMIRTVKDKRYVQTENKRLAPTDRGTALCEFLTTHFGDVLATGYTAQLEAELDRIASGERQRLDLLRDFWSHFQPQLKAATEHVLVEHAARPAAKPLTLRPKEDVPHG